VDLGVGAMLPCFAHGRKIEHEHQDTRTAPEPEGAVTRDDARSGRGSTPNVETLVLNVTKIHTQEPIIKPAGTGQLSRARQSNHRPERCMKAPIQAVRLLPERASRTIEEVEWN
jgi:hypothetical protein